MLHSVRSSCLPRFVLTFHHPHVLSFLRLHLSPFIGFGHSDLYISVLPGALQSSGVTEMYERNCIYCLFLVPCEANEPELVILKDSLLA